MKSIDGRSMGRKLIIRLIERFNLSLITVGTVLSMFSKKADKNVISKNGLNITDVS